MAWTILNIRNHIYSVENTQPVAPAMDTTIPLINNPLRPTISESGPIKSCDREIPIAKRLIENAISEGLF
ncbi:hypothetical protein RS3R2_50110 [Pseudomonas lactis]|nr:hypothetical protein RS3R2_50110 [Pseudomonas lactis]